MSKPWRTPRLLLVPLVSAAVALAVPVAANAATGMPDPTATGPHGVTTIEYNAGPTVVVAGGEMWEDELRGALHVPSGPGPFPVLLLLHGVASDCDYSKDETIPDVTQPFRLDCHFLPRVDHHRGFDYLGTNLASHGYLVVALLTHAHGSCSPARWTCSPSGTSGPARGTSGRHCWAGSTCPGSGPWATPAAARASRS